MSTFIDTLNRMVVERKKMTSPLYQLIMSGKASRVLLENFVIHRYPVKERWTRHLLGLASRIDVYELRRPLVENIYEEETGALSNSGRHLQSFLNFGAAFGVTLARIRETPQLRETQELLQHNISVCNDSHRHFGEGLSSVMLLMEGQPPIVSKQGASMLAVMRDVYRLPPSAYDYFVHHASSVAGDEHVSALEDDHARAVRDLLTHYCSTPEQKEGAITALAKALDLRHAHFDAILKFHDASAEPYRHKEAAA